jgi:hypothetical protein
VDEGLDARPTPEGRHRDGHDYVAMHLIRRVRCGGGETLIYPRGGAKVLARTTLSDPLDSVLVDDGAVDHEVTPLAVDGGPGYRDVLLVTFESPRDGEDMQHGDRE